MNARRKRRRDLERWRMSVPEPTFDEYCLNCCMPLMEDEQYASESGDGWFCRRCVRLEDDAERDLDYEEFWSEPYGSCENCNGDLYEDEGFGEWCSQCSWYAAGCPSPDDDMTGEEREHEDEEPLPF